MVRLPGVRQAMKAQPPARLLLVPAGTGTTDLMRYL